MESRIKNILKISTIKVIIEKKTQNNITIYPERERHIYKTSDSKGSNVSSTKTSLSLKSKENFLIKNWPFQRIASSLLSS